jgi:hypothetical protein
MKRLTVNTCIASALGLGLTLALLWLLGGGSPVTQAQGPDGHSTYYVAPSCTGVPDPCYTTIQAAVDATDDPNDVIKVAAGTYTDVSARTVPEGYPYPPTSGTITQVVFIDKDVTIQGGYTAVFTDPPDHKVNLTTLDAQEQGRVVVIIGDVSPTIEGLRITGGDALGMRGHRPSQDTDGDAGGGMYVVTAGAIISGCSIYSNTAEYGGGLYLGSSDATLIANRVAFNTAYDSFYGFEGGGGGLYLYHSGATLIGNTVTSNSTWGSDFLLNHGGGLYLDSSPAALYANTVTSNTADDGGGLYLRSSAASLDGNIVTSNSAYRTGGGLYLNSSDAILNGNTVMSNTSDFGGGGLYLDRSDATLSRNTVASNIVDYRSGGGGLYLYHSDATLSRNVVASNTAYGSVGLSNGGGGLHLYHSDATLNGNVFTSNAADDGGGLYVEFSNTTLSNNIIADNQITTTANFTGRGSGLFILESSPRLLHTTVAGNSGGDGSGVHITSGSTVTLTNTILVSHSVGITVTASNTVTINAILWSGTPITISHAATVTMMVQNQQEGNPVFADPDAGDYHIGSSSAAVDAGVDVGVKTDVDFQPRPYQVPDLGADEYWPPGMLKYIILPLLFKSH